MIKAKINAGISWLGEHRWLDVLPRKQRYAIWKPPYSEDEQLVMALEDFEYIMTFKGGMSNEMPKDLYAPKTALLHQLKKMLKILKSQEKQAEKEAKHHRQMVAAGAVFPHDQRLIDVDRRREINIWRLGDFIKLTEKAVTQNFGEKK